MIDGTKFGIEIVGIVKGYVDRTLAPVVSRLDDLEKRIAAMPVPENGKDADPEQVAGLVIDRIKGDLDDIRKTVEAIQPAPELPDVAGMISEAISLVPAPVTADEVRAWSKEVFAEAEKTAGVTREEAEAIAAAAAEKALAGLPEPIPGPPGEKGDKGEDGQPGKDGANITEALIDRDGCLVLTLSDGSTRNVGRIVGRDGTDVDMAGVKSMLAEMVAAIPRPIDGKDGFGFEDMSLDVRDDGAYLKFQRGDDVKEFRIPTVIDRGVWRESKTYMPGDGVTWAGSFWICQEDTTEKPDGGKGWRLAVKKGRDGKDYDPKGKP